MEPRTLRQVRHDLRGAIHQLHFTIELLAIETDPAERLNTATDIESAADNALRLLEELEAIHENPEPTYPPIAAALLSTTPHDPTHLSI